MANNDDSKKKLSGPPQPPHVSDLILGSLKPRTGKETSKWIASLADETVKEAAEAAARELERSGSNISAYGSKQNPTRLSVVSFMDQLFDFFQQIEFEFNKTVAGTDYMVTLERPTFFNEKVRQRFQGLDTVKVFRGHLSTRYWTLIMRAHDDILEGWVIPVGQIFGFRPDDAAYVPFLIIEPAASRGGDLVWRVNNVEMPWDQARILAKELFSALIGIAKGELSETAPFAFLHNDGRGSSEIPSQSMRQTQPLPPQINVQPQMNLQPHMNLQSQALQPPQPLDQKKILPTGSTPLQGAAKSTAKQTLRGTQARSASKSTDGSEPTIDGAIESLNAAIAKELEKLSAAGAEAFSKQDMAMVENIYKRTTRVKELQGQIIAVMQQWKRALKDALES